MLAARRVLDMHAHAIAPPITNEASILHPFFPTPSSGFGMAGMWSLGSWRLSVEAKVYRHSANRHKPEQTAKDRG